MSRITNSPLLSTAGILGAGVVFALAIYSFYPSSDDNVEAVPVIKAEAMPIKIEPVQTGGMEIPFQDSTVYDSMRSADASDRAVRIENLLEPAAGDEEPMSREDVIAAAEEQTKEKLEEMGVSERGISTMSLTETTKETVTKIEDEVVAEVEETKATVTTEMKKPVRNILEEENVAEVKEVISEDKVEVTASAKEVHKPAASPETLAFVRSVLDKKDASNAMKSSESNSVGAVVAKKPTVKEDVVKIEPAAGTEGKIVTKGSSYVQLSSIKDRSLANKEWAKLKEEFSSAIPGASGYRVQEANLEKGTFFRIQAGPYSEAQAKDICESIKAQKSGGCFVVK